MVRRLLLKDEAVDRPDPVGAFILVARLRLGMAGVMIRVTRRMRMDETLPRPVMRVAHRVDGVVRVRVRSGRKPAQENQHRDNRSEPAPHDVLSSVVRTSRVKPARPVRPYNAAMSDFALSTGVTAQKGETVAVVIDHDEPGDEALQVRFDAAS
jgi:hypothetical protein